MKIINAEEIHEIKSTHRHNSKKTTAIFGKAGVLAPIRFVWGSR